MILQFTVISTYDSQAGGDASDLGVIQILTQMVKLIELELFHMFLQ